MAENVKKAGLGAAAIALMAMYFIVPSQGTVLAAMADIGAAFPDVPPADLGYLSTMVSVGQIISALVSTALVTRRIVGYKPLFIVAGIIYLIGGVLPYIAADWTMIMACRFLFGLGLGCFQPLLNSVITVLYSDDKQRSMMIGFGNAFFNLGAVVCQMAGGMLCLISWQTTFLYYLVGIIPLVCVVIFFKEPTADQGDVEASQKQKFHLPAMVWVYLVMFILEMVFWYPSMLYTAVLMDMHSMGNSFDAGFILSFFTLIGIPAAILWGPAYRLLKKNGLPLAEWIVAISMIVAYFAFASNSMPLLYVSFAIMGVGQTWHGAAFTIRMGMIVNAATAAMALGLQSSLMNLGGFISTPYTGWITEVTGSMEGAFIVGAVGIAILGIVYVVLNKVVPEVSHQLTEEEAAA